MIARVDIQVDTDVLDAIRYTAQQSPRLMQTAYDRALRRWRPRILVDLRAAPTLGPDDYPRRWKSERQRRAYFATNGFGGGIPYRRTGALEKAWKITLKTQSATGVLAIENDNKAAEFVQGDRAQPMHLDSGWPQAANVVSKYDALLTDVLIDTWYTIADGRV